MPRGPHIAILLLCAVLALGMGKKRKGLAVSFHLETDASEAPKFAFARPVPDSTKVRYFKTIPSLSDRDVEWFYPFPAKDGSSGAVFKMNVDGTRRLEDLSAQNPGRTLLTIIHPGTDSTLVIDRVVSDGMIVVWDGVPPEQLENLREKLDEWTGEPPKK